jgi:glycosyltransferase involved in cell wall biosynthesis
MRCGENPTKFARHNPGIARINIQTPRKLSAVTITYIPRLTDYYRESLDVLKLSILSLRKTIPEQFDLIVFDNGSCAEAITYLKELKNRNQIQLLCLSSGNMKKLGAWNYLFSAAQGDFIYYFDSDIYHQKGWYEASMEIMAAFPSAGIVSAAPVPNASDELISSTMEIAVTEPAIKHEEGDFLDHNWMRELAISLGSDPKKYIEKKKKVRQIRLTSKNVSAYAFVWHAQFLARRELINRIFPQPRDWSIRATDKNFDQMVNDNGYMRLTTTKPFVSHLGNLLTPDFRKIANELGIELLSKPITKLFFIPKWIGFFFKHGPIRKIILKLHAVTFNLLYNIK